MKKNFMQIHDQYYDPVKKFISSLVSDSWVVDDLIQETFIKVERNIDTVRDLEKMSSWIHRIAYNICNDYFARKKKGGILTEITDVSIGCSILQNIEHRVEQHQMGTCVQQQMRLLPDPMRTILIMYDVLEFTHEEIAEIIGISKENSKVRLHRARNQFKMILNEKCNFSRDSRNVLICEPK